MSERNETLDQLLRHMAWANAADATDDIKKTPTEHSLNCFMEHLDS